VKKIAEYAPNVPGAIVARQVLTPLDLERTYGLTEGNIFHGDLRLEQLFFMRPVPGWAQYRTPIRGLYLCGASASRRRRYGRAGAECGAAGAAGLEEGAIQGGGEVSSSSNAKIPSRPNSTV
jgi:phytoene dehydrogenase-like protein